MRNNRKTNTKMIDFILDLPVVMLNTLCQWRDGEFSDRIENEKQQDTYAQWTFNIKTPSVKSKNTDNSIKRNLELLSDKIDFRAKEYYQRERR